MKAILKNNFNLTGVTLVELLVSIVVVVIITGVLFGILFGMLNISDLGSEGSKLQQQAREAMRFMITELKSSNKDKIILSTGPYSPTISFYLPQDIDGDGTIINSTTGNIEWNPNLYTYDKQISSFGIGQLVRSGGGEPNRILASYVDSILFANHDIDSNLTLDELRIILKVKKNIARSQRPVEFQLDGIVRLRN